MAVSEHEVLSAGLWLEFDGDVGQAVVAADAEAAAGPLDVHDDGVRSGFTLGPDLLDLIQQVVDCGDLVLWAPDGPRPDAGDPLQMLPDSQHNSVTHVLWPLYCFYSILINLSTDGFCSCRVTELKSRSQKEFH